MGIYHRVRRTALAGICACSVVAGIGVMAAPGSALAVEVKCANPITGSGSTFQAKQQRKWAKEVETNAAVEFKECLAPNKKPKIEYNLKGTEKNEIGSGKGLKEWGMPGEVLLPKESANGTTLDAYIGTDDPPAAATLLEAEKASGSSASTVPTAGAPIAVVMHLPKGCKATVKPKMTNADLSEFFLHKITWKTMLTDAGAAPKEEAKGCETAYTVEVRFDSSGTSFAFKQYLSQIDNPTWGTFVSDAPTWPVATKPSFTHLNKAKVEVNNQGNPGVAEAVANTESSVGYVVLANAATEGFTSWTAEANTTFWPQLQNNGKEGVVKAADPEGAGKTANCPAEITKTQEEALPREEKEGKKVAKKSPDWSKFHLATITTAGATVYPLCSLTYDIGWENYNTEKLRAQYGGTEELAKAVGATTKQYFTYMVGTGQAALESYYSALPTKPATGSVKTVAAEIVTKFVG